MKVTGVDGGVLQERNGYWYLVIYTYDADGNRIHNKNKWVSTGLAVKGNKRKAELMLRTYISEHPPTFSAATELSFAAFYRDWLDEIEPQVRKNTHTSYVYIAEKYILPYFTEHNITLHDLTADDISRYYRYIGKEKGLNACSVHKHHANIRKALNSAVDKDYIKYNPALKAILPKKEKYTAETFTPEQIRTLIEAARDTELESVIYIAVHYAMRRSEILGLKWSSVNLEQGYLTITSTAVPNGKETLYVEKTKTSSSRRTLAMTPQDIEYFKALKEKQAQYAETFGDTYVHSDFVCRHTDGRLIRPDYVTHKFAKILESCGLPHIRFHDLRHTFATNYIHNGGDMKHLQEWLGHSSIETTGGIYTHVLYESKIKMANDMAAVYGDISEAEGNTAADNAPAE